MMSCEHVMISIFNSIKTNGKFTIIGLITTYYGKIYCLVDLNTLNS